MVAKLQGDKSAPPVFHGTLLPMDFWTPLRFLNFYSLKTFYVRVGFARILNMFQERGGKPQKGCPRKGGESIRKGGFGKGEKASQRDGPGGVEASERDLVPGH